jgi:hypothetical protein
LEDSGDSKEDEGEYGSRVNELIPGIAMAECTADQLYTGKSQ